MNRFVANRPLSFIQYAGPPKPKAANNRDSGHPSSLARDAKELHDHPIPKGTPPVSPIAIPHARLPSDDTAQVVLGCSATTQDATVQSRKPHISESPTFPIHRPTSSSRDYSGVVNHADNEDMGSDESLPSIATIRRRLSTYGKRGRSLELDGVSTVDIMEADSPNHGAFSALNSNLELSRCSSESIIVYGDFIANEDHDAHETTFHLASPCTSEADSPYDIRPSIEEDSVMQADTISEPLGGTTAPVSASPDAKGSKPADMPHGPAVIVPNHLRREGSPGLSDGTGPVDREQINSSDTIKAHPERVYRVSNTLKSQSSRISKKTSKADSRTFPLGIVRNSRHPQGLWEVDQIVDSRVRGQKVWYCVKWKGFPSTANTWEPARHLVTAPISKRAYMKVAPRAKRSAICAAMKVVKSYK